MPDSYKRRSIFILLLILVSSVLFIEGYNLGRSDYWILSTQQKSKDQTIQSESPTLFPSDSIGKRDLELNKCVPYGRLTKNEYLSSYTVQKGDTLFSILNDHNWGTSRINDLIEINKDDYPGLSLQNPFIEVGWRLYLPPKYAGSGSGHYVGVQGEISEINTTSMMVNQNPDGTNPIKITLTNFTQFIPPDYKLSKGKCVRVVFDKDFDNRAISIVAEN